MPKGLYTNSEFVDTIIADVNESIKQAVTGNYILWCAANAQIVKKLGNLKSGIENDLKSRDETIQSLKQRLRKAGIEVVEVTPEIKAKGGDVNDKG